MIKTNITKLVLTTLITSTFTTMGPIVNAEEIQKLNENNESLEKNHDKSLADSYVKSEMGHLARCLSRNKLSDGSISPEEVLGIEDMRDYVPWDVSIKNDVTLNNDMIVSNDESLATHEAILHNQTDKEQKMKTAEFEYTKTDSVITKNSHSAGMEGSVETELKIPLIGGSKISLTAKYDFEHSEEVQTETQTKWSVPTQELSVPAGRKYKLVWVLKTGTATGTVTSGKRTSAMVPYKRDKSTKERKGYKIFDAIKEERSLENSLFRPTIWAEGKPWIVQDNGVVLRGFGKSKYMAKYGTSLDMVVKDITFSDDKLAPTIARIPMGVIPEIVE